MPRGAALYFYYRMTRLLPIVALFVLAGWGASMADVQLKYQRVAESDGDIFIEWEADLESDVRHYVISRRTPYTSGFEDIAEISAQGANKRYIFRDTDVYKISADRIEYRLAAVYVTAERKDFPLLTINYTPTAVRRTWGSIKAMFQ